MILKMETRDYKDIISSLRSFSDGCEQLSTESKEKLDGIISDIEVKTKKDAQNNLFGYFILFVLLIGSIIMWMLTDIQKSDIETDCRNKTMRINQYEKLIRFDNDSTHSFVYRTKDGEPITYQELMDENFNLMKQNNNLQYEISKKNTYLDVINHNYGIVVKEHNNYIWAEGAKVDSALLLLEVYRDRMKYDPEKEVWLIDR